MSESLLIGYHHAGREATFHPFCLHQVLIEGWRPLAEQLNLQLVGMIGALDVKHRSDVEQLVAELRTAVLYLSNPAHAGLYPDADYMRERARKVASLLDQALDEWEQVEYVSL